MQFTTVYCRVDLQWWHHCVTITFTVVYFANSMKRVNSEGDVHHLVRIQSDHFGWNKINPS